MDIQVLIIEEEAPIRDMVQFALTLFDNDILEANYVQTGLAKEEVKVTGLRVGADNCMVKPVSLRELIARVQAVLGQTQSQAQVKVTEPAFLRFGPVYLDVEGQRLYLKGELVKTSPLEYKLLHFLMSHPGKVFSRQQLLAHVWGNIHISERTVDVHVTRIRKILQGDSQSYVCTVHGSGYRFNQPIPLQGE